MTILLAEHFRRPLRLTPAEGLALLAAGRALLAVPGSDPRGAACDRAAKLDARSTFPTSSSMWPHRASIGYLASKLMKIEQPPDLS